ncbi:DHA2 family efflux MFS transporter permease subunit [Streptomyces syringium]|uniref:DHA2 family efflux MFS transporter permease subunit n=1 Tax=Streptomyces syringium TaxID=76729 RepID=UPI003661BD59
MSGSDAAAQLVPPETTTAPPPDTGQDAAYARGGLTLLMACGATFVAFLDVSVTYVAFPSLHKSFPDASLSALSWVVSSYTVVFAAVLAPAGRLADVMGRRALFLWSVAGFTLASGLCAIAPTVEFLVGMRVLQGISAAGMIPSALSLVLSSRPPERRSSAIGLWGASSSAAAAVGPPLGGLLVDSFGWPSVFLINVPLGVVLVVASYRILPPRTGPAGRMPDLVGTLAVALGVGGVVAALTEGSSWGWTSPAFLGALLGGAVLLALALQRSRRHPAPAVEISLWRSRKFRVANIAFVLFGGSMYCWLLAAPLFATEIWGYSEVEAGLALAPGAVMSVIASVLAGRYARAHQRVAVVVGGILFAVQCGIWMIGLESKPDFLVIWLPATLIGGVGIGAVMTGLSSASATALPPRLFAAGAGLATTARQVGAALGTAAFAALMAVLGGESGKTLDGFRQVFVMCTVLAALAAVAALWLTDPKREAEH